MRPALKASFFAAAALAATAVAFPAVAQISPGGGPISYSADNLEYSDNQRQLVLTGNVDVTQNDSRLQSDKLTLFFKAAAQGSGNAMGSGDIERIIAEGQVYYVTPEQKARGDRAVYDVGSDSVTFTGNVVVASEDNVIRGSTLEMQISSGRTVLRNGASNGRVQGVFRPKQGAAKKKTGE
jgi:lipopolysaccharide export system protein LptA